MKFSQIYFLESQNLLIFDSDQNLIFEGSSCDIPDVMYFQLVDMPVECISLGLPRLYVHLNGNLKKEE